MNEVAQENDNAELLERAVTMRIAFGADKKEWDKFIRSLRKGTVEKPKPVDPKEQLKAVRRLLNRGR